MNEKIKQLLARAHLEVEDIKDTNKIAEKFAELIIRDCTGRIGLFAVANYDSGSPERIVLSELIQKFTYDYGIEE